MKGLMMDYPLTIYPLLDRARRLFPNKEVVTKSGPGLERTTYAQVAERVGRLANALEKLGIHRGERVATFAFNNTRHLELYFAVPFHGRHPAPYQPAPAGRPADLHRQPRRRPGALPGPAAPAGN